MEFWRFAPTDLLSFQGTWQFMSTRLLSKPGKVHELCDDLESLWFVLLFEGLHFAKHNKPMEIDMATIFDQARVCLITGTHIGGLGKRDLYAAMVLTMIVDLEFKSKPFTILVRQIYQLFKSLHDYHMAKDFGEAVGKGNAKEPAALKSCAEIERLLREALDSGDWPEDCDKVTDQYPPTKNLTFEQKDVIATGLANAPSSLTASLAESLKRKREEEDDLQTPQTKRSRVDVPLMKWIWSKCTSLVWGRPASNP